MLRRIIGDAVREVEVIEQSLADAWPEEGRHATPRPAAAPITRRTVIRPAVEAEERGPEERVASRPRPRPQPAASLPPPLVRQLIATLSSRSALRRAILLQEILGPPVALRDPRDRSPGGRL